MLNEPEISQHRRQRQVKKLVHIRMKDIRLATFNGIQEHDMYDQYFKIMIMQAADCRLFLTILPKKIWVENERREGSKEIKTHWREIESIQEENLSHTHTHIERVHRKDERCSEEMRETTYYNWMREKVEDFYFKLIIQTWGGSTCLLSFN